MTKMGYIDTFDSNEKHLLALQWQIIGHFDEEEEEMWVSPRNLVVFLLAVDNISIDSIYINPLHPY